MKNYENFEVDDEKDESITKIRAYQTLAKIIIVLAFIVVCQIIYLLVIYSSIKETNSDISNVNLKKYMLADGNKKLDRALNEDFKKDYAYDEETKKKDNEIKSKEMLIKDYKNKAKKLQKSLNNSQPLEEILEINEGKKQKLNELNKSLKAKRKEVNSKILDSPEEINIIKSLIKNNEKDYKNKDIHELFKNYEYDAARGNELNYDEANYAINFNEHDLYILLFQTNLFGRYGIIFEKLNDDKYLIFDLNNKDKKDDSFESGWLKFKFDRQNLKLLLYNIKEYKFETKNPEIDYVNANITELEIFCPH